MTPSHLSPVGPEKPQVSGLGSFAWEKGEVLTHVTGTVYPGLVQLLVSGQPPASSCSCEERFCCLSV